jgi:hypothetical protein
MELNSLVKSFIDILKEFGINIKYRNMFSNVKIGANYNI